MKFIKLKLMQKELMQALTCSITIAELIAVGKAFFGKTSRNAKVS